MVELGEVLGLRCPLWIWGAGEPNPRVVLATAVSLPVPLLGGSPAGGDEWCPAPGRLQGPR